MELLSENDEFDQGDRGDLFMGQQNGVSDHGVLIKRGGSWVPWRQMFSQFGEPHLLSGHESLLRRAEAEPEGGRSRRDVSGPDLSEARFLGVCAV